MCKHATPLEYSIFLLVGSEAAKDRCLQALDAMIEPREDDVRCYALPARGFQGRIGRASLPATAMIGSIRRDMRVAGRNAGTSVARGG